MYIAYEYLTHLEQARTSKGTCKTHAHGTFVLEGAYAVGILVMVDWAGVMVLFFCMAGLLRGRWWRWSCRVCDVGRSCEKKGRVGFGGKGVDFLGVELSNCFRSNMGKNGLGNRRVVGFHLLREEVSLYYIRPS